MKHRFIWVGALALAIGAISQVATQAAYTNANGTIITNGVIIITTRAANDGHFYSQSSSSVVDLDDNRGPGYSPGDSAMGELLGDFGYSVHMLPDRALNYNANNGSACLDVLGNPNDPSLYYNGYPGPGDVQSPYNELLSPMLVVLSGSGSSATSRHQTPTASRLSAESTRSWVTLSVRQVVIPKSSCTGTKPTAAIKGRAPAYT